ncbi:peptide chain release factor 2 [Candidatus Dojkabacteria bacterium]|uniref:Peptide chain release factor 2 n=1 Tax=Candidatus Dojkabacteria bacterium TaxID=2099670 RepID=A0A955L9E1_9BACT|nr:peptide chain release factor 2 [Candidatus Dojkabacteria bacterium]
MTLSELKSKFNDLESRFNSIRKKKNLPELMSELEELEKLSTASDFWSNQEKAQEISRKSGDLRNEIEIVQKLESSIENSKGMISEDINEEDIELVALIEEDLKSLENDITKIELSTFLSGKFDSSDCILTINAGQGGTEAMDWSEILLRMYMRYITAVGWKADIVEEVRGTEAGYQTVVLKVQGRFAYGYLKHEQGTHRLVRNSPFNSAGLRQTSFANVLVEPVVNEDIDIEVKDEDLEFNAVRSSGAGGQNVNKVATKVRLKHKPSGITVESSAHRTQHQNRVEAMKLLKAKLYMIEEEKREAEMNKEKGEYKKASWGNQIRNYVLSPYKLVKDLRTGVETAQSDSVLDGDIQEFIDAEVRML